MLRSANELKNYVIGARDGEVGRCKDFLFDDSNWTVRYMVADTGKWLPKKKVLVSPIALDEPDWKTRTFRVRLSKSDIENSPPLDSDAPVSREYERELNDHHQWAPYWYGAGVWGASPTPHVLAEATKDEPVATVEAPHHNIRSVDEVSGYSIQATDGEIGHVEDLIIDDETWIVRYIVVDTRNWLPGCKVIVAPTWAGEIDWQNRDLHIQMTRDEIKNSPEYDPGTPVNREYETQLYDYYGRPRYWDKPL